MPAGHDPVLSMHSRAIIELHWYAEPNGALASAVNEKAGRSWQHRTVSSWRSSCDQEGAGGAPSFRGERAKTPPGGHSRGDIAGFNYAI
jgi:hypothetical protein